MLGGIIATIWANILTAMIDVCKASDEEIEPVEPTYLLGKVGKSIATMTRSSVRLKLYKAEVPQKIAARLDELEQEVKNNDGRVSLETV
ncbi:MAG: hypothetical protein ACTS85_00060 [Arsenophonus sp. NC-PG7-MAG3]